LRPWRGADRLANDLSVADQVLHDCLRDGESGPWCFSTDGRFYAPSLLYSWDDGKMEWSGIMRGTAIST